jgi:hypothetical protein
VKDSSWLVLIVVLTALGSWAGFRLGYALVNAPRPSGLVLFLVRCGLISRFGPVVGFPSVQADGRKMSASGFGSLPGPISRVVYLRRDDSAFGMVCYKFPDGVLVPIDSASPWTPTDDWRLQEEVPFV